MHDSSKADRTALYSSPGEATETAVDSSNVAPADVPSTPTPFGEKPEAPSWKKRIQTAFRFKTKEQPPERSLTSILTADTGARDVNVDYRVPKWLQREGVSAPYQYSKTFKGRYGVINYDVKGETNQRTVVAFHGLYGTLQTFSDLQNVLARYGFRVITFDLYGHGLSAAPQYSFWRKRYSGDFFVAQARELLEHLNLHTVKVAVLGFSMGGIIAARFATLHPETVDAVVLVSAAGLMKKKPLVAEQTPSRASAQARQQSHSEEKGAGAASGGSTASLSRRKSPSASWRLSGRRRASGKRDPSADPVSSSETSGSSPTASRLLWNRLTWQVFAKKGSVSTLVGSVSHVPMWDGRKVFEELALLDIPCLVLWGLADSVVSPSCCEELLAILRNKACISFPGARHLLLTERRTECIAATLTFLDFPSHCFLPEWRFLLPFDEHGVYVPPSLRAPPGKTSDEYLRILNYAPNVVVKLPCPEARSAVLLPPPSQQPLRRGSPTPGLSVSASTKPPKPLDESAPRQEAPSSPSSRDARSPKTAPGDADADAATPRHSAGEQQVVFTVSQQPTTGEQQREPRAARPLQATPQEEENASAAAEAPLRSRTRISSVRRRAPHHTGISLDSLTVHDLLLGGEAAASAALQDSELYVQQSE